MPNYCECYLRISNDTDESGIAEVENFIKDDSSLISFNKIVPYPDNWRKLDDDRQAWEQEIAKLSDGERQKIDWSKAPKDGYNQDGYNWCVLNWGTKWDACNPSLYGGKKYDNEITLMFETAWAPPTPAIDALALKFPKYLFCLEYYERGMQFCGSIIWEDGKRKNETQGEYFGFRGG